MTHSLTFNVAHDYAAADAILLPVVLRGAETSVRADACLDTDATVCVFKRELAAALGLTVEAGTPLRIGTVTGGFTAYGHMLTLETLGYAFDVLVYLCVTL